MTQTLRISKDLTLPLDAITQTFGVVAARGSGKSYLAAVLAEELVGAGLPVCIIDPLGVFWGLRSSADGKREGLPVVILGGDHGDVPLDAGAGKVIADWVVGERRPCVLDLSIFRKGEQRQFVTDFAEHLYRANREPLHLVLDEADLFAPQRPMPGEQRMLGAIEDLVRRGRARGLGLTLITQRPAVVHKDVLTQVSALVALRMLGPQDRDAVDAWIKFHGSADDRKKVLASLASLPIGRAWFWSPGWLQILKQVQVRKRTTFDSSSTPDVGAKRVRPERLAPVELEALTAKISASIERAKQEDPKALRKRIVDLERELAKASAARPEPLPQVVRVEVPVVDANGLAAIERMTVAAEAHAATCRALLEEARALAARPVPNMPTTDPGVPTKQQATQAVAQVVKRIPATNGAGADPRIGTGGLRRMLTTLAQRRDGLTAKQIAVRAGMSCNSGTFSRYLSMMRSEGWAEGRADCVRITEVGLRALGSYQPLPTGSELLGYWLRELGDGGCSRMLRELAAVYPKALTNTELAERSGMSDNSGTFSRYLSTLRSLQLAEGRGQVRASEELFS